MARKAGSYAETTAPKVRAAALALIAQHGFAAVTMRQIAGAVGLQAGALYSYTKDKQSLLADLMVSLLETRSEAWRAVAAPDAPLERLEAFARFHLGHQRDAPDAAFVLLMEERNLEPGNLARVRSLSEGYIRELVLVLEEGAQAKLFAVPDARLAAEAVLSLLNGAAGYGGAEATLPPERVDRITWNMVRRAVGAKGFQ